MFMNSTSPQYDFRDTFEFYKVPTGAFGGEIAMKLVAQEEAIKERDFFAVRSDVNVLVDATRGCATEIAEDDVVLLESIQRAKTEVLRRAITLIQANTDSYIRNRGYYFNEGRFLQGETKVGLKYMPTQELYRAEGKRIRNYVSGSMGRMGFKNASVSLDEENSLFIVVEMSDIEKKMVPFADEPAKL